MRWLEEQRDPNHPHICIIEKVVDETPTVRTLYFHDPVLANVLPGQFAMVWIPGVNELPMSVMISENDEKSGFTVRKRGESSTALYNLQVGQQIGVRGPYGNSFDIKDGEILLIGGGTGLVPLMRLIKFSKDTNKITLLMGSQTKEEVFLKIWQKIHGYAMILTASLSLKMVVMVKRGMSLMSWKNFWKKTHMMQSIPVVLN